RDAACNVNAAECENFESKIAGFSAVDRDPEVDGLNTDRASLRESFLGDFGSGIGVRVFKTGVFHFGREKFVKRAEAAAGQDEFPTDLRVTAAHKAEELDLLIGVGREIGMAAFGGNDAITLAIQHKDRKSVV